MRRATLPFMGLALALILAVTAANAAQAHVGLSHGFGPHTPTPLSYHVGPLYWTPGDQGGANHDAAMVAQDVEQGPTALDDFVKQERCDRQRAEYFARHGVTTPAPLKGFHGCAKAALDAAYWRHRRNEPSLKVQPNAVRAASQAFVLRVHNLIIGY